MQIFFTVFFRTASKVEKLECFFLPIAVCCCFVVAVTLNRSATFFLSLTSFNLFFWHIDIEAISLALKHRDIAQKPSDKQPAWWSAWEAQFTAGARRSPTVTCKSFSQCCIYCFIHWQPVLWHSWQKIKVRTCKKKNNLWEIVMLLLFMLDWGQSQLFIFSYRVILCTISVLQRFWSSGQTHI